MEKVKSARIWAIVMAIIFTAAALSLLPIVIGSDNAACALEAEETSVTETVTEVVEVAAPQHGFCIGWVLFIFVILTLLYFILFLILRHGKPAILIEKCKLNVLLGKGDLLSLIGACVSAAVFIFALVAIGVHVCPITVVSFAFALFECTLFTTYFLLGKQGGKLVDLVVEKLNIECSGTNAEATNR